MNKNPQKRRYPSIAAGNQKWLENLQPHSMVVHAGKPISCGKQESLSRVLIHWFPGKKIHENPVNVTI
jgi:hypothetical protein